jgi:hypothetical protein
MALLPLTLKELFKKGGRAARQATGIAVFRV